MWTDDSRNSMFMICICIYILTFNWLRFSQSAKTLMKKLGGLSCLPTKTRGCQDNTTPVWLQGLSLPLQVATAYGYDKHTRRTESTLRNSTACIKTGRRRINRTEIETSVWMRRLCNQTSVIPPVPSTKTPGTGQRDTLRLDTNKRLSCTCLSNSSSLHMASQQADPP